MFHEIVDFYRFHAGDSTSRHALQPIFGIASLDECLQDAELECVDELAVIHALLADDGLFVTADRCPSSMELLEWVRNVERHGFAMALQRSSQLAYHNNEFLASEEEVLPISVFVKDRKAPPVSADDILGLKSHRSFSSTPYPLSYHQDATAEVLYSAFSKNVAYAHCAQYHDRSGIEKLEIGLAGPLVYAYRSTSLRFRWLLILPVASFHEQRQAIEDIYLAHKAHAELKDITRNEVLLSHIGMTLGGLPAEASGPEKFERSSDEE